MIRSVALLLAALLAIAVVPPHAAAAAGITGLFIDGTTDPLSDGAQTLYGAPDATVSVVGGSSGRTVVALASSVDGWLLTFGAPDGPELALGAGSLGLVIERGGRTCERWFATATILELAWAPDDTLTSFAADFQYGCMPGTALAGSVRYNATTPIKALSTGGVTLDLGQTELGTPGEPGTVTVTNIGHVPVALGAPEATGPDIERTGGTCQAGALAAGASCTVTARLTGARPGLGASGRIQVPDDTALGMRDVVASGEVWTDTTTTLVFDPARSWIGGQMFVGVEVTPAPDLWGTVTVSWTTAGGAPASGDLTLISGGSAGALFDVTRGDHDWTATFNGIGAWRPSTSATVTKHAGLPTATSVVAEVNPITAGDTVVLHSTTTATGGPLPAGTVTFREGDGPVLGTDTVGDGDPAASASIPGLALGRHDITATYASSEDGSPSSATTRVFVSTHGIEEAWSGVVPMVDDAELVLGPVDTDGAWVYVAGSTTGTAVGETSAGGYDIVVARFSATTGALDWVTQLGTAGTDRASDLVLTAKGVFVAGTANGSLVPGGLADDTVPVLARLTPDGDVAWIVESDRQTDLWQLARAVDGGVYAAASAPLRAAADRQGAMVRRYAQDGTLRWERELASCCFLGKQGNVNLFALASDPGGLLIGGWSYGSVTGGNDGVERGWVRRLSASGVVAWTRELVGAWGSVSTIGLAANEAAILATGNSQAPIAGQPNAFPAQNIWMRRSAFDGTTTWTKPLTRESLLPACRTFVGTSTSEALPSGRPGGTIAELRLDGTDGWRYEHAGTLDAGYLYEDAAVAPGRAFVVEHVEQFGDSTVTNAWRVVGLSGIPATTGCDTAPPTVTAPHAAFVTGTHLNATASVRVTWSGKDATSGVARYELRRRPDGGAWTTVDDGLSAPSVTLAVTPWQPLAFRAGVVDRGGNRADASGPTVTLRRLDDRSPAIRYGAGWRSSTTASAVDGTLRSATAAGATASVTFTGRAFAWVAPTGPTRGSARVYVDGAYAGTVSLYRSAGDARRVVFAKSWARSGTHTVTIRVAGTAGHARVDVDALLVLR